MLLHVADWEQSFSPEAHSLKSTDTEIKKIESGIYLDVTLITLNVAFETQKGFVNTFSALWSFEWYVLKNILQLEHYDFVHHLCCISIKLRKLT